MALILDPGSFALTPGQDTIFVGFAKDARNYATLRYYHGLKRVGWDLRVDGKLVTNGQEPHGLLDGTTDLSGADARYALVQTGTKATAYADQGKGWEFLFAYDTAGVIDLRDPDVRADYHYALGVRLHSGTITLDALEARRA